MYMQCMNSLVTTVVVAKRTLSTAQWSGKPRVPAPLAELGGKDGDEDKYTIQIHIQHKYNMNTTQIQFYYNANQDTLVKGSMCLRS